MDIIKDMNALKQEITDIVQDYINEYYDIDDVFSFLTDEEAGKLIKAVFDFELRGTVTEFQDRMITGIAFALSGPFDQFGKYVNTGIYPYVNNISYHFYATGQGVDDAHKYEDTIDKMESYVIDAGGWKEMYLTECGWPTGTSIASRDEDFIAEELPRMSEFFHKPVMANVGGFSVKEYVEVCERLSDIEQVGWLERYFQNKIQTSSESGRVIKKRFATGN